MNEFHITIIFMTDDPLSSIIAASAALPGALKYPKLRAVASTHTGFLTT